MTISDETLARNDRYLLEIVEALEICPFARGTRTGGKLDREVHLGTPTPAFVADRVRAHDEGADIVLLIFPELALDAKAFERFVDAVRTASGDESRFAMAPFHPQASYAVDTPSRLVGLFRRAPDPTIQLVRYRALDAVKRRAPDGKFFFDGSPASWAALAARPEHGISDQITHANFDRLAARADELRERLAAIGPRTAR